MLLQAFLRCMVYAKTQPQSLKKEQDVLCRAYASKYIPFGTLYLGGQNAIPFSGHNH